MSRDIGIKLEGKFLGKIEGYYKTTPIIVSSNNPPCHSTTILVTRKIRNPRLVTTHTTEKGEITMLEKEIGDKK